MVRNLLLLALATSVCLCSYALAQQAAQVVVNAPGGGAPAADAAKPIPLVSADEELATYLTKAAELIEAKDYAAAINILQAMLDRAEQTFVPTPDGHRFVSLAARAAERIGQLPEEGLKLYRALYDTQAERVYRLAAEKLDEAQLRFLIRRYVHTSGGQMAMNMIGAILFDRGEFAQAARYWRDALRMEQKPACEAVLLAKIAASHHLAGEEPRAQEAFKLLQDKHADAEAQLGGQKQKVVDYARRMMQLTPPPTALLKPQDGWYACFGTPDAMGVMSPCQPVMSPRWTAPTGKLEDNPNVRLLTGTVAAMNNMARQYGQPQVNTKPELREGQIVLASNGSKQGQVMPATIHPVIVGNAVIYRSADAVVSYDLTTGEELWRTLNFPVIRAFDAGVNGGYFYNGNQMPQVQDEGKLTVTVGGNRVFAVGQFLSPTVARMIPQLRQQNLKVPDDTSVLACFSLSAQGRLLWKIGDGLGSSDVVKGCRFLCAPTYANGRLYVVAEFSQAYHLLTLDADNGKLLWTSLISQTPVPSQMYYGMPANTADGSAPSVADGTVYVVTNAGVVAAYEADTGSALWAYQYDESATNPRQPGFNGYGQPTNQLGYSPNPVIVTRDRVIVAPNDHGKVLALRRDSGELIWQMDRRKQQDLTAIDPDRVLLSGPSLMILSTVDGKELFPGPQGRAGEFTGINGRPAVTSDSILASGQGKMFRVSLSHDESGKDYNSVSVGLTDSDAYLGNLITVGGKLVAANAAGLSAYFTFEEARDELTARLAKAPADQTPNLTYLRGMNAFNASDTSSRAERLKDALTDLTEARKLASGAGDTTLAGKIDQGLYRTYIAMANNESDHARMLELFSKAGELADSTAKKGEMAVRMVKYQRLLGNMAKAAELAQAMTVDFENEKLVDVEIGTSADPFVKDDPYTPRKRGYDLGHQYVRELIEKKADAYAVFDAKAKAELDAAVAKNDPEAMVAVKKTYVSGAFAPLAMLRAAESHYRKGVAAAENDKREAFVQASQVLNRMISEYPKHELIGSARLGMVMVYQQIKPRTVPLGLKHLDAVAPDVKLAFADLRGTRDEMLAKFGAEHRAIAAVEPEAVLPDNLTKLFSSDTPAIILRDNEGKPILNGKSLLLWQGKQLICFDPSAKSYKEGVRWEATLPFDATRVYQMGYSGPNYSLVAGLSQSGKVVAICTRAGAAGVNLTTGKVEWKLLQNDPVLNSLNTMCASDGHLALCTHQGQIAVIEIENGKEVFNYRLNAQQDMPIRTPIQVNGGLVMVGHGRQDTTLSVFDIGTKARLGAVACGNANQSMISAGLTEEGVLVACGGRSLDVFEPMTSLKDPVWTVPQSMNLMPAILDVLDGRIFLSPSLQSGVLEVRDVGAANKVALTLQAGKGPAVYVWQSGKRIYVLSGQPAGLRGRYQAGMLQVMGPKLHAFDAVSGQALWTTELAQAQEYVMIGAPQFAKGHIVVLVKSGDQTKDMTANIIELEKGEIAQKVTIEGAKVDRNKGYQPDTIFRQMCMSTPVPIGERLVAEGHKGLTIYGKGEPGSATKPAQPEKPAATPAVQPAPAGQADDNTPPAQPRLRLQAPIQIKPVQGN